MTLAEVVSAAGTVVDVIAERHWQTIARELTDRFDATPDELAALYAVVAADHLVQREELCAVMLVAFGANETVH